MANGDDGGDGGGFSFDPGNTDVYATGGLQPNDPLYDWGSNLHPSQIAKAATDMSGFADDMAALGKPPPEHHYDGNMNPISADHAAAIDAGIVGDPSAGNLTSTGPQQQQMAQIQARRAVLGQGPPDYSQPGTAMAYGPEDVGTEAPAPRYSPSERVTPSSVNKPAPTLPPAPPPQPAPPLSATPQPGSLSDRFSRWFHSTFGGQGGASAAPYGPNLPPKSQERPDTGGMGEETAGKSAKAPGQPLDITPTDEGIKKAQDDLDKANQKRAKALSDFGKAMQGIKVPERPKLPPLQSQGVRQAHPITPNAMNLLGLIGQGGVPTARASLLAQLLGRIT